MLSIDEYSGDYRVYAWQISLPRERWLAAPKLGWWLSALGILLAGYACMGKGFAYLGVPPLFVGEIVLGLGIVSMFARTDWRRIFSIPFTWFALALCSWTALRTAPYVGTFGIDALRDAALCCYSVMALVVVSHLLENPARLMALARGYAWFTFPLALGVPIVWAISRGFDQSIPHWPWADVQMLDVKGGDAMTHLAGILAFWLCYPDQVYKPLTRFFTLLYMSIAALAIGSETRSGLVAFGLVFLLCLLMHPRSRALWGLVAIGIVGVMVLAITDWRIQLAHDEREVSFDQISYNFASITGDSHAGSLDETKDWRLNWWNDILNYTIRGKYFWSGKGFGVNLADDDGYQVADDEGSPLRSPHSCHLNVLARAGIPGLALWISLLGVWIGTIGLAYLRARLHGQARWAGLFLFLFAYWAALLIQASFDVYLEGPVGG
ncbi:MAG TPA: O-antigen ligase family protein, partial [Pirellulales bacterium]